MGQSQSSSKNRLSRADFYKLVDAARYGDYVKVKDWLEKGVPVDYIATKSSVTACGGAIENTEPTTALEIAVRESYTDIVELLISYQAEVNTRLQYDSDNTGYTLVHIAALNYDSKTLQLLLDNNADVDGLDSKDNTPLHCVIASNMAHPQVVSVLIEAGANINAQNRDGMTPLMLTAQYGHTTIAKLLLLQKNQKVDTNCTDYPQYPFGDYFGHTAKYYAEKLYRTDIARVIGGHTAKYYAEKHNRTDITRLICSYEKGEFSNPLEEKKNQLQFSSKPSAPQAQFELDSPPSYFDDNEDDVQTVKGEAETTDGRQPRAFGTAKEF